RRIFTALATLAGALLAFTATAPAALAVREPPPGEHAGPVQAPSQVHTIIVGGMPGWQIALIAAAAALAAAAVALLLDRAWAARKAHPPHRLTPMAAPGRAATENPAARPGHRCRGPISWRPHNTTKLPPRSQRDQLARRHNLGPTRLQAARPECTIGLSGRHR